MGIIAGMNIRDEIWRMGCYLTDNSPLFLKRVYSISRYEMNAPKSGSSHYTFRKKGCKPITIPKHEPIKKVYVEMVKQIVESEERSDENAE